MASSPRLFLVRVSGNHALAVMTSRPAIPSPLVGRWCQVLYRWCCVFSLLSGSLFQMDGAGSRCIAVAALTVVVGSIALYAYDLIFD